MLTINDFLFRKIYINRAIKARNLIAEAITQNQAWSGDDIRKELIKLSENGSVHEIELIYPDHSNESIFIIGGTQIRMHK